MTGGNKFPSSAQHIQMPYPNSNPWQELLASAVICANDLYEWPYVSRVVQTFIYD
jgi:hypothetical protein